MRIAVLCCALLGILPGINSQDTQDTTYTNLNPEEFYLLIKSTDNHILIDTRTRKEYRRERIPGAILAANKEELLYLISGLDLEQPILVYCSDNYRSQDACRILAEKGFMKVFNLLGGLTNWKICDYSINKKRPPRKHQFSH